MMMVLNIKVNGKMISKKDKDQKAGQMDHYFQVYIRMGKKLKVFSNGPTVQCLMVSLKMDKCMEKELILGTMVENTPGIGCMEK